MRVGVHVSISPSVDRAADYGHLKGCDTIQVFTRNPRGWRITSLDPEALDLLKTKLQKYDIHPLIAHASYLPNMASPDDALYERSIQTLATEVARADAMGAEFFVTHVGHHKAKGAAWGVKRVCAALNKIIAQAAPRLMILLENTADSGKSVGESFEQLQAVRGGVKHPEKVGVCLDTCHAFAHGYDIVHEKGLNDLIKRIERLMGLENLKLVHLNDSAYPFGSHHDRHEHIGRGKIGEEGFRVILSHPVIRNLPGILETPVERPGDDVENLTTIRRLLGE